ncbi:MULTISPECIES: protein translocase subunit SecF [Phascolarctobacterium]|jgi:preprotein translocase subunit SecF|uniref:protein translocase subunit SecF n=1 Tax=Phascolarctobacterium TaxID=33024 RepID=UPI0025CEC027|nr:MULTISPECIES: protein translocase subunit SecF [Phascolarctobacterium]
MKFSIVKRYKIFFAITITFLIIGLGSMIVKGFNMGIDFTGGSIMDLQFHKTVSVAEVRDVLKERDLGNAIIQLESSDSAVTSAKGVLIRTGVISDEQRQQVMADLKSKLGDFDIQRVENVGATIGGELIQQAVLAIVLSWVLMIAYITIRFEFRFALAAIIALIIDVTVTLSYFSLFHVEMDSSFVAALLTVVGYSVNGTIVIFDRIRENLKIHRRSESMTEMVDNSIWQTMGRSIYTVGTSLFAVVSIFLWGGETIRNFAFAMLVGFSSGAYTSTLLAGPLWMLLRKQTPGKD